MEAKKVKVLRKITKQRLKNIALYYLKRFDSSVANLKDVLRRRTNDYARFDKEFDKAAAYVWIDEILAEFVEHKYLDDERYAEIKVRGYLAAGKPSRYIMGKMREKGVDTELVEKFLEENEYDPYEMAMRLAKKKKIGPYREEEKRVEFRQKDMAALVRAGFDYEVVKKVMEAEI